MNTKQLQQFIDSGMVTKIEVSRDRVKMYGPPESTVMKMKAYGTSLQTEGRDIAPGDRVLEYMCRLYKMGFHGPFEFSASDPFAEATLASAEQIRLLVKQNLSCKVTVGNSDDFEYYNVVVRVSTARSEGDLFLKSDRGAFKRQFVSESTAQRWIDQQSFDPSVL
jgi:hypothetical protein